MKAHITHYTSDYRDVDFEVRHENTVLYFEYRETTGETRLTGLLYCLEELPDWMVENLDKSSQTPGNSVLHLAKQACQDERDNARAYHLQQLELYHADKNLHSILDSGRGG